MDPHLQPKTLLTVSPFYHYNGADYQGGPNDYPVISTVNQNASYAGGQTALHRTFWRNDLQAGLYGFGQHQHNYFNNVFTDGTPNIPPTSSSIGVNGGVVSEFINDKFKVTPWFTLITGLRATQFNSTISETATDPRFGAALRIPRSTGSSAVSMGTTIRRRRFPRRPDRCSTLADSANLTFAPLHGERDIQWQYGVTFPYRNWTLSINNYETRAENWLDHNNIGESNIFWPITWSYALIQGWSLNLHSPDVFHHGQFHLAYANQIAQATSPITGGLICPAPVTSACPFDPPGLAPVDHDQRNTLNVGFDGILPGKVTASTNVYYGSGFTNGLDGTPQAQ